MFVTALLAATLAAPVPKINPDADSYAPYRLGNKWVYDRDGVELSEEVTAVEEKDGVVRVTIAFANGKFSRDLVHVVKEGKVLRVKNGKYIRPAATVARPHSQAER